MPELPPCTSSVSPGRSPASMKTFDHTVQVTSGSAAASTRSTPGRHRQQLPGRARPPARRTRRRRAARTTSSPTAQPSTPSPRRGDPAGALQPEVRRGAGRRVVVALPLQQVGPVDRAGGDVDEDLARSGDRVGHLLPAQDLGSTRPAHHDGAHGPHPRQRARQRLAGRASRNGQAAAEADTCRPSVCPPHGPWKSPCCVTPECAPSCSPSSRSPRCCSSS